MKGQSKTGSLLEATLNMLSGFCVSFFLWQWIGPKLGYDVAYDDTLILTLTFTLVSIVRSYAWRRLFNWIQRRS